MLESFCHSILQTEVRNSKALANLVMGLASQPDAKSVVELSLGNCYHYQYSSINKAISTLDKPYAYSSEIKGDKSAGSGLSREEVEKKFVFESPLF